MARIALNIKELPANTSVQVSNAGDLLGVDDNGYEWVAKAGDMLWVVNELGSVAAAQPYSIERPLNAYGRGGTWTYTAGLVWPNANLHIFRDLEGWVQTDGKIYVNLPASSSDIRAVVLRPVPAVI